MAYDTADISGISAGRLELRLKPGSDEYSPGFCGAYTTVLVRCESAEQFVRAAARHVGSEGFEIIGIERLFPLASGQIEINQTIEDLVDRTREFPMTTFHMFKGDG